MFITNDFHQLYNRTAFFSERHQPLFSKDMASNDQALWFLSRNQKAIILVYSFWVVRSKVIIFVHPSVAIFFPSYMFPLQTPSKGNILSWGFGFFLHPEKMLNKITAVPEKWALLSPGLQIWYPTVQCLTGACPLSYLSALGPEDCRLKSGYSLVL